MSAARDLSWLRAALAEARRLRALSVEAECDFLLHLSEMEKNVAGWMGDRSAGTGFRTFEELLAAEDLCQAHRLAAFKAAVARFGFDTVRRIGFEPSKMLLSVPREATSVRVNAPADVAIVRELSELRERSQTTPSEQNARSIVQKHYVPPKRPAKEITREEELSRENAALRAEVKRLTKALAIAEAKVAKYERERSSGAPEAVTARAKKIKGLAASAATVA